MPTSGAEPTSINCVPVVQGPISVFICSFIIIIPAASWRG